MGQNEASPAIATQHAAARASLPFADGRDVEAVASVLSSLTAGDPGFNMIVP